MCEAGASFGHFLEAQAPVYAQVEAELRAGNKTSHWMWFIFPQLRALGRSATAQRFGLADLGEARAYADHAVLGARLRACAALANAHGAKTAVEIFGAIDALKYRSCLTLFLRATDEPLFRAGLDTYYGGSEDPLTLAELRRASELE